MKGSTQSEMLRCNSCSNTFLIINRFNDDIGSVKFLLENCEYFAKELKNFTIVNGSYTHRATCSTLKQTLVLGTE